MLRDLIYAFRALRRDVAFTAVVVVSIALGIAANTTVFSMVNGTLFGDLPVRDARRLYTFSGGRTFPYADYRDYRDQCASVFESVAGHFPLAPANLAGSGTPERVWGQLVSGNYFSTVGPRLALGRGIGPGDDAVPGRSPVVVLGNGLWRRRFGGDANVVGKPVMLNGREYTVAGVMAPGFRGTERGIVSEFWAPLAMRADFVSDIAKDAESRATYWIMITARLKPGVTHSQAVAAMNVVNERLRAAYRKDSRKDPLTLDAAGGVPGERKMVGGFMATLMVVVGLVLLVACANVANLLLVRAAGREQEIGIRLAIGAGRGRLIRQLLVESVTLSGLGSALGFAIAYFVARAISSFELPLPFPILFDFTPDLRVLGFTAALAIVTGIVFGLAPAIAASRTDLISVLKQAGPGFGVFRRFGLRNLLVALQVTLSVVLLIGSGLFLRSLQRAASIDLGIRPENVLTLALDPKANNYSEERMREFLTQVQQRVGGLPGVRSMTAVNIMPLSFAQNSDGYHKTSDASGKPVTVDRFAVLPRFFETTGIPLLRGRDLNPAQDLKNPVAVINQTAAKRIFGNEDPIGQRITGGGKTYEIVGISGDSKSVTLGEEVKACAYTYLPRDPSEVLSLLGLTLLVKTAGEPGAMVRPVRDEIEAIDRNLAVFNVGTLERHVGKAFLVPRLCATLFGAFGLIGLVLASVGLYGVVSHAVRSRTREIGIRMALGAQPISILRLVLTQGMALVGIGLGIGLAIAFALSRFTASLLYGISATDAVTFSAVPAVLLLSAVVAVALPARRAARVEPMRSLRFE